MKQSFVYGALVLLLSGLFNRVLGFVYQIIMIRLIHPEGIGLFAMVYPVYVLALVLATAGVPVAISKLVAEEAALSNMRGAYRIFKACLAGLVISSSLVSVLCFLITPALLKYVFPNPKVYYIFLSLIPGVLIVALGSALKGFFQGMQQMTPSALTQSLEQLLRVVSGLFFARLLLPKGVEFAAVGASLGVVIGEMSGLLLIAFIFIRRRPRVSKKTSLYRAQPLKQICGRVSSLAVPVTLTRFISTLFLSIDAVLIPQRLQAGGLSLADATAAYGQFVGIAQSILFVPGIVTISLATALIPAVSDALALNNIRLVRSRCETSIRVTLLAGLPCVVIFLLLADELCGFIFGYAEAGASLKVLALGGIFLYLQQTTTGILQGMGEASRPFRNLVIASACKITGIFYLTGLPHLGIKGCAAAIASGYLIMACLNISDIYRLTGLKIKLAKVVLKPLTAAAVMAAAVYTFKNYYGLTAQAGFLHIAGCLLAGMITYLFLLLLNGSVDKNDVKLFKNGSY
ncbi:stage V sporulation protein B [Pelotomaculum propionicicum]|nr:stage V sporulation protein B [Pelotomaculum propionicicum]